MGMFDEIRCEVTLPDSDSSANVWFQTKSFPSPCLQRYVITSAGRLVDSLGNDLEVEGYVTFYASGPGEVGSREWHEYRARFLAGQLQSIVRVSDSDNAERVHYGLASFRYFATPSFMFGDPNEK